MWKNVLRRAPSLALSDTQDGLMPKRPTVLSRRCDIGTGRQKKKKGVKGMRIDSKMTMKEEGTKNKIETLILLPQTYSISLVPHLR